MVLSALRAPTQGGFGGAELGAKQEGLLETCRATSALPLLPAQGMKTFPTAPLPVFLFTEIPKRVLHLPSSCQAVSSTLLLEEFHK